MFSFTSFSGQGNQLSVGLCCLDIPEACHTFETSLSRLLLALEFRILFFYIPALNIIFIFVPI